MLERWKSFLDENKSYITQQYLEVVLPQIFGIMLYHFFHSKSYSETEQFDYDNAINAEDFKSITTYYHHEPITFYYAQQSLTMDTKLTDWLQLTQFETHDDLDDGNISNSWGDKLREWLTTKCTVSVLTDILEKTVNQDIKSFFLEECRRADKHFNDEQRNVWQEIYHLEIDRGELVYLAWHIEAAVFESFQDMTVKEAHDSYLWFYHRYKASVEKAKREQALQQQKRQQQQEIARHKGMQLLPEFRRRLIVDYGLIVPNVRFYKNIEIWSQLKDTLDTFSVVERAAIIFVSDCSNSVRMDYLRGSGLFEE